MTMRHDEQPNRQAVRDELRAVEAATPSLWQVVEVRGGFSLRHDGEELSLFVDEARALRTLGYVEGRRSA